MSATAFIHFSSDGAGESLDGLAIFRFLLLMAVICRTALVVVKSNGRRSLDAVLICMIGTSVLAGLIENQKTLAALPVLSYVAACCFYRRGIPLKVIASLLIGGVIFVVLLAPMVNALRAMGQKELSPKQQIAYVFNNLVGAATDASRRSQFGAIASDRLASDSRNYFGEPGSGQLLVGRYSSIQQIDPVVAAVDHVGVRGGEALWPAFVRLVPSLIYPDKPLYGCFGNLLGPRPLHLHAGQRLRAPVGATRDPGQERAVGIARSRCPLARWPL